MKVFFYLPPPFLTNKIKAWHLCMTANLFNQFRSTPPSSPSLFFLLPPEVHGSALLSALLFFFFFLYQPLSSLEPCKSEILVWRQRAPQNRKEVPVILFSPVVANSDVIRIQLCMFFFCLLWWIKFLKRSSPSPPFLHLLFFFLLLLPLLAEAWALTHVVLTVEICSSAA